MKRSQRKKTGRKAIRRQRSGAKSVVQPAPHRRQAILVLGMHRSGTSALTRVLSLLGATLPSNLLGANSGNKAGHWESVDLIAIHDKILSSAGSRWDDWRAFNPDWNASQVADPYKQQLRETFERNWADSPLFVVKDPRICRFVPVWLDLIDRIGAQPHVVIPIRNPLEVAVSLKARNGFLPAKSYLLWLRHVLDAERDTRALPRAFVTYDGLLKDWREVAAQVARRAKVRWPRHSDFAELEIDNFLATALRHHSVDAENLSARAEIVDWVRNTYDILQEMAAGNENQTHLARLDQVRADFDRAARAFGLVLAENEEAISAAQRRADEAERWRAELAEQERLAAERLAALEEAAQRSALLAQEVEAARKDLTVVRDEAHGRLEQSRQEAVALRQEVASKQADLHDVQAQVQSLSGEAEQRRAELAEREREAAELRVEVQAQRESLAAKSRESDRVQAYAVEQERLAAQRLAALEEAAQRSALLAQEVEAVRKDLTAVRDEAHGRLEQSRQEAAALREEIASKQADLREVQVQVQLLAGEAEQRRSELAEREQEAAGLRAEAQAERENFAVKSREFDRVQAHAVEQEWLAAKRLAALEEAAQRSALLAQETEVTRKDLIAAAAARDETHGRLEQSRREAAVLREEVASTRVWLREAQTQVQSLAGEADQWRCQLAEREQEVAELRAEAQTQRENLETLNGEFSRARAYAAEQERLAADRLAAFKEVGQQAAFLGQEIEEARKDINTAMAERDEARSQLEQFRYEAVALRGEVVSTQAGLREMQMQTQAFVDELKAAQTALTVEQARVARMAESHAVLQSDLARAQTLAKTREDGREHHRVEADRLRRELQEHEKARATEADRFRAELAARDGKAATEAERAAAETRMLRIQAETLRTTLAQQAATIEGKAARRRRFFPALHALRMRLSRWRRLDFKARAWEVEPIRTSKLFSPLWYLEHNPDVAANGDDPLEHYLAHGGADRRNPHPLFDARWYVTRYPQAAEAKMTPLTHYVTLGVSEGLDPMPLFDTDFYLLQNPDVAASGINPLYHYMTYGAYEGRDPHLLFDSSWYLEQNPDVAAAKDNPLLHYVIHGWKEDCNPHPDFDTKYYLEQNPDVAAAAANPLEHYVLHGETEGRQSVRTIQSSPTQEQMVESDVVISSENRSEDERLIGSIFDESFYRYQLEVERRWPSIDRPLQHYLHEGYRDLTLLPNILFNPSFYIEKNELTLDEPALLHYVRFGDRFGYSTCPYFNAGVYNAARPDTDSNITAIEHFFKSSVQERHISDRQMTRPISVDVINFIREIVDFKSDSFASELLHSEGLKLSDLPLAFYADEYWQLNADLANIFEPDFMPLFTHYLRHGRHENRMIGKWQLYIDLEAYCISKPVSKLVLPAMPPERKGVCVLMHVFYGDLMQELATYANSFGSDLHDVFINVVDTAWSPTLQTEIRNLCPGAFVMMSPNTGRDIGGFLRLLEHVDTSKYEIFAFMHTKKSPHIAPQKADYWRRKLLNAIAGNREIAARCIQLFRNDPRVGFIGCEEWRATDIAKNTEKFEQMLDLFDIEPQHRDVEYLSGTMFLIHPQILRRLYDVLKDIELESGDDKTLAFNMDGQLAHAIERVIGNLVRQLGFRMEWVRA